MSLSIDELSSLYGLTGVNGLTQSNMQNTTSAEVTKKATEGDSYISTISMMDTSKAIPSENYNDLAKTIQSSAKTDKNVSATEYGSVKTGGIRQADGQAIATEAGGQTAETSSAGGTGSAGGAGGGGSDSEEETETEVVTIDGQTYLQTTTTDSNGNTTVSRTPIGGTPSNAGNETGAAGPSPAAQALTSL